MANGISLNDLSEGTADLRIHRIANDIIIKAGNTGEGNVLPETNGNVNFGSTSRRWQTMYGLATSSQYADLAERYTIEGDPKIGDVILISPKDEIDCIVSDKISSSTVIGVVSEKPAIRMNEDLVDGKFIALRGRVPCKVQGPVQKGDCLVSYTEGSAIPKDRLKEEIDTSNAVFAKALETNKNDYLCKIEVVIL